MATTDFVPRTMSDALTDMLKDHAALEYLKDEVTKAEEKLSVSKAEFLQKYGYDYKELKDRPQIFVKNGYAVKVGFIKPAGQRDPQPTVHHIETCCSL